MVRAGRGADLFFAGWSKRQKIDKEVHALAPDIIWNYFNEDGHECGSEKSVIELQERGLDYEVGAVDHFVMIFTTYFNDHNNTKMPYTDFRAAYDTMTVCCFLRLRFVVTNAAALCRVHKRIPKGTSSPTSRPWLDTPHGNIAKS